MITNAIQKRLITAHVTPGVQKAARSGATPVSRRTGGAVHAERSVSAESIDRSPFIA